MKNPKPKTVELVKSTYQPSKAEKEEAENLVISKADGSLPSLEELAQAVLRPIKVRWIDKPRNRR